MIDDKFIGPVILYDYMTRYNYVDFLQNGLLELLEDVPLAALISMYFQHDGAPSHYTLPVMQHRSDTFPNQWIGCGSLLTGRRDLQT
jgi:hypothetical protein